MVLSSSDSGISDKISAFCVGKKIYKSSGFIVHSKLIWPVYLVSELESSRQSLLVTSSLSQISYNCLTREGNYLNTFGQFANFSSGECP